MADLAAEEAATAAALTCEQGKAGCEDLVVDVLSARPGLDFLCIGGPRPRPGETDILEAEWLDRGEAVLDPDSPDSTVTAENTEVSGVGVLSVSFVCETDGAVAPLRGVFPTVSFRGQASEVAILQGAPKASLAGVAVKEGNPGGDPVTLTFTLTLDAPAVGEVVLPFTIVGGDPADGRATADLDYRVPVPAEVTIREGAIGATIEVGVVSDGLFEVDEKLVLRLEDPADPADLALINLDPARREATGTIENDDAPPAVTVSDAAEVTEGDRVELAFEVAVEPSGAGATVGYETRDGDDDGAARTDNECMGSPDPDYVATSGTLTFAPSGDAQTQTVTVTVDDDLCGEGPETVELWLTPTGAGFAATADTGRPCGVEVDDDLATQGVDESETSRDRCAVGVIVDDEPGVEIGAASACEVTDRIKCGGRGDTGGVLVFTVRRVGDKTPEVSVHYATVDNDAPNTPLADAGEDYTPVAGPCTISSPEVKIDADGEGTATFTVAVSDDVLDEGDETFVVVLCDPSDNAWIQGGRGVGTIFDDDPAPTVRVGDASVGEGAAGAGLGFPVVLSAATGRVEGVRVRFCTETVTDAGSAAAGVDYTAVACPPSSGGEVRFEAGETGPKDAVVAVSGDVLDEADETVVLRLEASNAGFADPDGETGACPAETPDDAATPLVDESANGGDMCAVGVIVDDDDPPLLRVRDARGTEGAPLTFAVDLVSAADPTMPVAAQRPVTVGWRVVHVDTVDGDLAVAPPPPATQLAGAAVIRTRHTTTQIRVPTFDDSLDEMSEETFTVVLEVDAADPADPEAAVDAGTAGTGTVVDDDDPPVAGIVVCPDAALVLSPCPVGVGWSATEGATLTFRVRLDAVSGRDVVVGWRTAQKTPPTDAVAVGADSPDGAGADYVNAQGAVTVAAGETEGAFVVVSVDDRVDEREYEFFEVRLDGPPPPPAPRGDPAYRLGAGRTAEGRIVDDDAFELRLRDGCDAAAEAGFGVDESSDNAVLTVVLCDPVTGAEVAASSAVVAGYRTRERPSERERERAAGAGADFAAVTAGDVTIAAGSSRTTVSVAVSDDDLFEHDETFLVQLQPKLNMAATIGEGSATVVIRDDDPEPGVSVADASVGEGGAVEFALTLRPVAGRTVTVDYRTAAEGAAVAGTDCAAVPAPDFVAAAATTASFAPGEVLVTARVQTCDDSVDEDDPLDGDDNPLDGDDETFTLRLGGFDGIKASAVAASPCPPQPPLGAGAAGDDCAVGRIEDDDARPKLSLEGPAGDLAESSGTAAFTARLDNPSGRPVSATVTFGDPADTATRGGGCGTDPPPDYEAAAAGVPVSFAAGDTVFEFSIDICDDTIDEQDIETLTARIVAGSVRNADLDTATVQARIADDDEIHVEIVDDDDGIGARADEGQNLEFTVRLIDAEGRPASSTQRVTVTAATRSGTANLTAVPHNDVPDGASADYTAIASRRLRFEPGAPTSQTVAVAVLADSDTEPEERLQLRLTNPSSNATLRDSVAVGVINGQCHPVLGDLSPPRLIARSDVSGTEGETLTHRIDLDPAVCQPGLDIRFQGYGDCARLSDEARRAACEAVGGGPGLALVSSEDFTGGRPGTSASSIPNGVTRASSRDYDTFDDDIDEPDEFYRIMHEIFPGGSRNPAQWHGESMAWSVGTIIDNDTSQISVAPAQATEGDDGHTVAVFTLTLSAANSRDVEVDFRPVANPSADAPATPGASCTGDADFITGPHGTTIPAGATSHLAAIRICGDTDTEHDETLLVHIDSAKALTTPGRQAEEALTINIHAAQITILNDDNDDIHVEIVDDDDGIGARADEGENLEFTVRLIDAEGQPASSTQPVTVDAATFSGTANLAAVPHNDVPDGATADYTAISDTTLTFAPDGPTSQTVAVAVLADTDADTDPEPEERLQLRLTNPSSNATLGDHTALGVINGDCRNHLAGHDPPALTLTAGAAVEGGIVYQTLTLDPRSCNPTSIDQRRIAVTATDADLDPRPLIDSDTMDAETCPADLSATQCQDGFIHMVDVTDSHTYATRTADDDIDEPDETFRLDTRHGRSGPQAWRGRPDPATSAVGTIIDNDTSEVSVAPAEADEGDDGHTDAEVTFALSVANSRNVEVSYRPVANPSADAPATAGADCTGDADFITGPYTTTIPAGATTATGTIRICGDTDTEHDETLLVRIDSAEALSTPGRFDAEDLSIAVREAQYTILNDDEAQCLDPTDDSRPPPTVSITSPTADESDVSITFTVSFPAEICEDSSTRQVRHDTGDGTAAAGRDYRRAFGYGYIRPGQRSVDVEVELIDDNKFEPIETFTFTVRSFWRVDGRNQQIRASSQGTIEDDDDEVLLLEVSNATPVAEGADLQFTVSLVDADGDPVTSSTDVGVDYHTRDLTATAGTDYTGVPASSPERLVFRPGQSSRTVSVPTLTDSVEEADERLQLRLANPSDNTEIRGPGIAVGTIRGDCVDPGNARHGRPEASFVPLTVPEAAGTVPFELHIGCTTTAATWRLAFSGVTARLAPESTDVGAGYTFVSGTADAAAADRIETFAASAPARIRGRIAVNDDRRDEPDETLRARVTWMGYLPPHWASRHWDFTLAIADNDAPEVVAFSDVAVLENAEAATLTLELRTEIAESVSVKYTTVAQTPGSNSATPGSDYTHVERTLTIPAGARRATMEVPIIDDSDIESDETFQVRLSEPGGGLLLGRHTDAQVTIQDHDGCVDFTRGDRPPRFRQVTGIPADHRYSQYNAAEEGEIALMGFELDRPLCRSLQFAVHYNSGQAQDFYVFGTHDSAFWIGGERDGGAGNLGTFEVQTFEDNEIEPTETFSYRVYWCDSDRDSGTYSSLRSHCPSNPRLPDSWHHMTPLTLVGRIFDDDDPEVTVANVAAVEVAEDAGEMVFVMELDPPPKSQAVVRYRTAATPSAGDRAATRGLDYTHTEGTLTIPVGAARARIRVPIMDDELEELDETFLLRLWAVSGLRMADPSAQGTILDDDAPLPEMSLEGPAGVFEGDSLTFTVSLSDPATRRTTVGYRTVDGTATAGADYTGEAGTLTFRPGDTAKTVTVDTRNDRVNEGTERFELRLENESQVRLSGTDRVAEAVVYDVERPPPVTLSVADASAREGDPLEFAVTLDAPSLQPVTLVYSTSGGTATAGADYTAASSRSVTVGARSWSGTIRVPTARDSDPGEGDETVGLAFGAATGAAAPSRTPTGTIRDGPSIGTPEISVSDAAAVREGTALVFAVTADPAPASAVTVQYRTVDGTATAGADYTANFGRVTFGAGDTSRTVEVATIDDGVNEVDETLRLELARVLSGHAVIGDGDGEGTIIGEKATISIHDATVDEEDDSPIGEGPRGAMSIPDFDGGGGNVEVRLDRALGVHLRYRIEFRSDTAVFGAFAGSNNDRSDFWAQCGTIPAGKTLHRCEIMTLDDGRYEGTETAEMVLVPLLACPAADSPDSECSAAADHVVVGGGTATLTITEDEAPLRIKASDATIDEGSTLGLDVNLGPVGEVSDRTVTLDWATEDGTAVAGEHYTAGSGTVTFAPATASNPNGVRRQTIIIKTGPNSAREGDKVFYVRLSRPHHATLWGDSDNDGEVLIKITIDDDD